jgi:hypothetical protein
LLPERDSKDRAIMMLSIELLGRPDRLRERLLHDGWNLKDLRDGSLRATHVEVPNQVAPWRRLCELGLLTSASLRIEFPPWLKSARGAGSGWREFQVAARRRLYELGLLTSASLRVGLPPRPN